MDNWTVIYREEVDSTNDWAMQKLQTEADLHRSVIYAGQKLQTEADLHRSVIYAGQQKLGKGQKNRSWVSEKGNSYSTYILKAKDAAPWADMRQVPLLGMVTALSIGEALIYLGVPKGDVFYKWPNDVWLKKSKIAGVLPELYLSNQNELKAALVGAGVNLHSAPKNLDRPVASLYEDYNISVSPQDYLAIYLKKLDRYLDIWQQQSINPLMKIWKANSHHLGELLKVQIYDKEVEGCFYDFSDDGGLILRLLTGELKTIHGGEVFFNNR